MFKYLQKMLLIAALCVPWVTQAQSLGDYTFSTGTDASMWIDVPTSQTSLITPGAGDYGVSTVQNIGFSFPFGTEYYTQFSVNADGNLRFGGTVTGTSNYTTPFSTANAAVNNPKINVLGCDGFLSDSGYVRKYNTVDDNDDSLLVIEFATSTYTSSSRPSLLRWQIHLYPNGNINIVYASTQPPILPAVSRQCGMCIDATDLWLINASNVATHYTAGQSTTIATGTWPAVNTFYSFVRPVITCPAPSALTLTNLTSDGVDVSWTPMGTESQWEITCNGQTDVVSSTIYSISNLQVNTPYEVSVRAICGVDDTSFAATTAFRTLCTSIDSLPYSYGFEDMATGSSSVRPEIPCWHHINNGTQYFGYPYVSSTTPHSGTRNLYWYGSTTATTYGDYQIVVLPGVDTNIYPINTLRLKFWARPTSTSYYPVFQVGVMSDPNDVSTFQLVQTVNVQNVTTWQEFSVIFGSFTGSGQFIAVRLNRPGSSYYVYTDDFTLEEAPTCAPVATHHVTATASSARITWSVEPGFATDPDGYNVSYSLASNTSSPTTVTTTDPELTLTGLDADSAYIVTIVSDCGNASSPAYTFNFHTQALPCIEWDTTGNDAAGPRDTIVVGTPGTTTTNVMPVNQSYNYSYCQHLVKADEIAITGPTTISGIGFDYAYTQPMTHATNCSIYMAHTTVTSMSDFVPYSTLQLVYSGPLNCTQSGWNYFQFNQGDFQYDGTSNMIVAIVDNSGSSDGSAYIFRYSVVSGITRRVYNDATPYGPTEMAAATTTSNSQWRSNMRLLTGGGGDCIAQASCIAPAVSVEQADNGDIELSWIPGYQETDWDVDYRAANTTTWTNVATGTSNTSATILISDLQPNTEYIFRVTANCNDTNISATANFTTPCSFISIPYMYGFEDMATGSSSTHPNIPCWHHINNGTSYYGYPYVSSTAHNSSRSLYWYLTTTTGTYGDYEIVVLPPVDIATNPINTLQLTFWAKPTSTSYAPVFLVGVMTDPTDVTTFQFVDSVILDHTTTDWMPYEAVLSSYTGTGRYVAVRANRPSSAWYAYTDDFALENAPACPRITGVAASNITQHDATISWTATAASEYEVQYGPAGFTLGAGTFEINITDDSVALSGLTTNTAYDVYVRGICTDDTSNWSFVYTFRTACGILDSLPFTEDFENQPTGTSSTGSPFIPCWTRLNNGTSYPGYPYVSSSSTYNHTQGGTKGLYWYGSTTTGTYGDYQYIILPQIDTMVYPINTLQLGFWAKASSTSYHPVLQVGVMNSNTDTAMTVLGTINVNPGSSTEWGEFITSLSEYTGSGSYVAIRALRPSSTWYVYVDDITLELLPPCPRVEELHAINATLDSITIVWTDTSSTNTSWVVEYDTVDFTPGDDNSNATSITVTDTIYNLSGLDSAHTYHIYVYPICDDYIGYRHITAATLAASPATVPYTCDFEENGPNGWDFLNDGQTNYWIVDSATHNGGGKSMYITNDGHSNAYNTSTISYSYAIRTFNLSEPGEYAYSYDWKGTGESHYYDFTRVFVTPASEMFTAGDVLGGSTYAFSTAAAPASWIELTQSGETPNTLAQQSTWTTVTGTFTITTPGNYKMVFVWANDGSGGTQPPTAIDNVSLVQNVCPSVDDLNLAYVTIDSAIVTWNSFAEQTGYIFEYDSVPFTPGNATNVFALTDTSYVMTGLTAGMTYYVSVRAECTGDTALAATMHFTTLASLPATVPYSCDFEQSGVNGWDFINGTQGNYWIVGSATNNGGTQSMYITDNGTANNYSGSESYVFATRTFNLAAGNYICSYDWKGNGESSFDFLRVALVPAGTQLTAGEYCGFDNGEAPNGSMPAGAIALDGGGRMNLQTSWNTEVTEFTLTTAGSYKMVFLWRNDGSIYNQPPAAIDNVQLMLNSCPMPQNITATNLAQTSADISWVEPGTATEWQYQLGSNAPVIVTDTFCTVTGLAANTGYTFRVRSICGQGDTSMWASYTFRTPCGYLTLPYIEDFETYGTGTTAFPSCWYKIGSTADRPYIYATTSYGHNNSHPLYFYAAATGYCYAAMPPVDPTLSLSALQVSFWARQYSTSYNCDFVVGVMTDPTNASTFTAIDTVHPAGTTYEQFNVPLLSYTGTGNYIAFSAVQHPGSSTAIYMMLDDVVLEPVPTCLIPQDVTATEASTTSITIDWTDLSTASAWEIRYGVQGSSNTNSVVTTSHPYTISGLDTLTSYNVEVRAICTVGDTSRWSNVTTLGTEICDNAIAASTGTASGTTYYAPVNNFYKYTLTETIIDSAELAGIGDITAIAYSYAYGTASTDKTDVTIWLQPTNKTTFSGTTDIEALDTNTAVQVYTGDLNCSQGWNYFTLDTVYQWDGHSNLLVIVDDNSNDYNSSSYVFDASACSGTKTLHYYSDSYNPDPLNPSSFSGTKSSLSNLRPTMKLVSCGAGCAKPSLLPVTDLSYNAATINWNSNATDFEVAVKAANEGTWPAEIPVTGNSYDVTGLDPSTNYQFRVRAICDTTENLISDWAMGSFTTDSLPCFEPSNIHTESVGYTTATLAWTAGQGQNQWSIHVWNSAIDTDYVANANPYTVTGLRDSTRYFATVKAICGNGVAESGYSDTVEFTTGTCAQVTGVNVTNLQAHSATVSWTSLGVDTYEIEYGNQNFSQGDGTKIVVNGGATTYNLTGLTDDHTYSVFVRAKCEEGVYGKWSTKVDFTTPEETGINTADGTNLSIFPNPTSNVTTISVNGVNGEVSITIVDMNGRTVLRDSMECEGGCTKSIEVSGLAQGAYFVRVSGDSLNMVKKLIVK